MLLNEWKDSLVGLGNFSYACLIFWNTPGKISDIVDNAEKKKTFFSQDTIYSFEFSRLGNMGHKAVRVSKGAELERSEGKYLQ